MCSSSKVVFKLFFVSLSGLLNLSGGNYIENSRRAKNYSFPDDFMFGVSTAAYQIEGAWNEGGKGENVWDTYLHEHPNFTIDHSNGDVACDSYHKYMEDIELIKNLNVGFYRTSISWARILPNGTDHYINKEGVEHYRKFFKELIKAGIVPVITLYHWDLPSALMKFGGWTNSKMVDYFEDYARVAFKIFGDLIKNWITINEIRQYCINGYGRDMLAPALLSPGLGEYLCFHYKLLAHARAYRLYENEFRSHQKGKVGIAIDSDYILPKNPETVEDQEAAERYLQMNVGIIAHPIFSDTGDYPKIARRRIDTTSYKQGFSRSRLPHFTEKEIKLLRGSSDFIGLNHYTTNLASSSSMEEGWYVPSLDFDAGVKVEQDPAWPKPGVFWESVYPPGFRGIINWFTRNYGKKVPIIVMENGFGDHGQIVDHDRISYINSYLNQLLLAIHEDGCNVRGYFAWSLLDNFEWKNGYTTKFGLYHVDFNSPNRTRSPKLSVNHFRDIVRTRQINVDYLISSRNCSCPAEKNLSCDC